MSADRLDRAGWMLVDTRTGRRWGAMVFGSRATAEAKMDWLLSDHMATPEERAVWQRLAAYPEAVS